MRETAPKFNPAVLPTEYMKRFERTDSRSDWRTDSKDTRHFLYPGQVFATSDAITISTILGSCAAICLWDRHKRAGGMNHYLLPEGLDEGPNRLRYGNVANPELLKQVLALGCEIKNLQAKIFGGSSAFAVDLSQSLGTRNVDLAETFLRSAGIPIVERDVSGKHGRRLIFQVGDGLTSIKSFEQV
jgi:chemotaxis receptor (MCP) glutamine deamidase CheD